MEKFTADWKKQKSMKPIIKSFRESIDFPVECFEIPKKYGTQHLSRNRATQSPNLKRNSVPQRSPKNGTKATKEKSITEGKSLARRSPRLNHKNASEPTEAEKSKDFKNKKDVSGSGAKSFNSSFNVSFDDSFVINESHLSNKKFSNFKTPHSPGKHSVRKNRNNCASLLSPSLNQTHKNNDLKSKEDFRLSEPTGASNIKHDDGSPNLAIVKRYPKNHSSETGNCHQNVHEEMLKLSQWGLPQSVVDSYHCQNITTMFKWQAECLSLENVLKGGNLVYSAPTSAGKTLVAEILMLKKVVETKKKGLMILPFVSVAREKVNYLQKLFGDAGVTVDGYMGTYNPPGGFNSVDIAICTIEKANNLINRLIEDGRIDHLGIIVVDELHMLGDPHRGYLLELLLTKLLYTCKKNNVTHIQIVGMSATLPNLNVLSVWLRADLYHTDFRPVPLQESFKVGTCVYDSKSFQMLRDMKTVNVCFPNDSDHTIYLALETVLAGHAVLVFCPTKNWCEKLAENIAREVFKLGSLSADFQEKSVYKTMGSRLREVLDGNQLQDILDQLRNSPAGLDNILGRTVPFGVAFHHAGLTFDERDIIENAFRFGIIKFLVATSTLSSGVNLPAKRVIIRSPLFCGTLIDVLTYKQMVGRAGRKGIDTSGESILLCKESEKNLAKILVESGLRPVKSCLVLSGSCGLHSSLKRAILEIVASGVAQSPDEINHYTSCTLLSATVVMEQNETGSVVSSGEIEAAIDNCLQYLIENEFISLNQVEEEGNLKKVYQPTRLGQAVLASGFAPDDSLRILKELQLARRCFVLDNDLHILYEVIPPYLSDQMGQINWFHYLSLWEQLPDGMQRVGELVGVQEQFIGCRIQGQAINKTVKEAHRLAVHQRFYAALALNDLIQEIPLSKVSEKYNCSRGILQSLQQTTSTFAGMLTVFCGKLGWYNMELLFGQFQKRVHFGVQQELCDLVRLPSMNGQRARIFYNAGYETVAALASAHPKDVAFLLRNSAPFESGKQQEGETEYEALRRNEAKNVYITGKRGLSNKEAAEVIVNEARRMIEQELGVKNMQWKPSETTQASEIASTSEKQSLSNLKQPNDNISNASLNENLSILNNKSPLLYREESIKLIASTSNKNEVNVLEKITIKNNTTNSNNSVLSTRQNSTEVHLEMEDTNSHLPSSKLKRKIEISTDGQSSQTIIQNNIESRRSLESPKAKKAKRESDSIFNDDLFSLFLNDTFSSFKSRVSSPKSNAQPSSTDIIHDENGVEKSANHLEKQDDEGFLSCEEDLILSQAAEMENIYLSRSLNHELLNSYKESEDCVEPSIPGIVENLSFSYYKFGEHSTPIEKSALKGVVSSNDSCFESQVVPIDEKINLNKWEDFSKNISTPEMLFKDTELADNVSEDSDFKLELSFSSMSVDPDTEELFPEDDDKNNLKPLTQTQNHLNNSLQTLNDDLSFNSQFSMFSASSEANNCDNNKCDNKKCDNQEKTFIVCDNDALTKKANVQEPRSKSTVFYKISDLSLNFNSEESFTTPKTCDNSSNTSKNMVLTKSTSGHKSSKILSTNVNAINSMITSDSSVISEAANECVSPTPPKVSVLVKSMLSGQTRISNTIDSLLCDSHPKGQKLNLSDEVFQNSESDACDYLCKNLFPNHEENGNIILENQNEVMNCSQITDCDIVLTNDDLLLQNITKNTTKNSDCFTIKDICDDNFLKFLRIWSKKKKFSLSAACEKRPITNSNVIGPQMKANKKSDSSSKCQWFFGDSVSVVGLSVCWDQTCVFYVPFSCKCFQGTVESGLACAKKLESIQKIFEKHGPKRTVSIHDFKAHCRLLYEACGITVFHNPNTVFQDPAVGSWMLNPDAGEQSLITLVSNYIPSKTRLLEDNFWKPGGLGFQCENSISAERRAAVEAFLTFELMDKINVLLQKEKLHKAFNDVEMPILCTLAEMEQIGLGLDTKVAVNYRTELQQKQLQLLQKAHQLAGRKFNLASSKDIARVLYKELKLCVPDNSCASPAASRHLSIGVSTYKKRQRLPPGLKTNKEALEKLKHLHPLPEIILNWRKISFCLSKVLMPLLKSKTFCNITNMDRLHSTSYIFTVTGRVNMHHPNLQFIPRDFDVNKLKEEEEDMIENENSEPGESECSEDEIGGISLRNMFIPSKGHLLLSADYSQLELRMLAHLSHDKKLISLLNQGKDVFKMIASSWKQIPLNEISDTLRQQAKQICYGMIYGIGPKTLSHQLNVSVEEATVFMDSFKDTYPNVKEYLKSVIENCKSKGYIITLGNRRRYLPSVTDGDSRERTRAERQAINTTIQGSAADLFKSAILKVKSAMSEQFPGIFQPCLSSSVSDNVNTHIHHAGGGFLVLQLHDELIFEVYEKDLQAVADIVRTNMENCLKLSVVLPVKLRVGNSWGSMTEFISA